MRKELEKSIVYDFLCNIWLRPLKNILCSTSHLAGSIVQHCHGHPLWLVTYTIVFSLWGWGKKSLKLKLSGHIDSASHLGFQVQRLSNHFYHYFECVNYMSGSIAPRSFPFTSSNFTSTPFSTQFLFQSLDLRINQEYLNLRRKLHCLAFNKN